MTKFEIMQECADRIASYNGLMQELEAKKMEIDAEIAEWRYERDAQYLRIEQLSDFPPEGAAPPVDMADPEYNPYAKEANDNGNALYQAG